jgi:hypothetical protein
MLAATGTSRYFILDSSPSASSSLPSGALPPSVIQPYPYPSAPMFATNPYFPLPLVANSQLLPASTLNAAGLMASSSMTASASGTSTVEVRKSAAAGKRTQQSNSPSSTKFRSNGTSGKAAAKNVRGKNYVSGVTGGGRGISIGSADGGGLAVKWGKTQLTFKRDAGGPIISLGPAYSASSKSYATIKSGGEKKTQ